ncbi:MAG: hypothetical protein RI933_10 [Actinomycetota bacterium]|jgi:AcrR family transcriptional regulator
MSFRTKHFPQPKQDRAKDTVDLVIKEADKAIKAGGEAAVRIQEISKAAKVSIGSIYHHFGDRDGLIRATYVHNFSTAVREDINRVKRFMSKMHTTQEIASHYDEMLSFLTAHFNRLPASDRACIVGNTMGRPMLRQALAEVQNELTSGLTEVMEILRDRKMLKPHLTPRSAAVMVLGMLHGKVVAELDTDPIHEHEWNQAMLSAFSGLFVIDNQLRV